MNIALNDSPESRRARLSWIRLLGAIVIAFIVLAPYGYFGMLLGVAVHEIAGHGLASLALGGRFIGFQLDFDGMGWAFVPFPAAAPAWKHVVKLSAGILATSVIGTALMLPACLLRKRPWVGLPLLVVSFAVLMDGIPYVLWNALHPVPPGDIGRILAITGSTVARASLVAVGAILMIGVTWFFTAAIFGGIQSWITGGGQLTPGFRLLSLVILGAALAWFMEFDWDQIAPGIDPVPNLVGWILHPLVALSLMWLKPAPLKPVASGGVLLAGIAGWILVGVSILCTALWFRQGLFWVR